MTVTLAAPAPARTLPVFKADSDALRDAVAFVVAACPARTAVAVLACIRLTLTGDTLHLAATDYDLAYTATVTVAGNGDGTVVVPGRTLTEYLRRLPTGAAVTVTAHKAGDVLDVNCQGNGISLRPAAADDFPDLPEQAPAARFALTARRFCDLIPRLAATTAPVTSPVGKNTPMCTAIRVDIGPGGLRMEATDQYRYARLALTEVTNREPATVAIPAGPLAHLVKHFGGSLTAPVHIGWSLGRRDRIDVSIRCGTLTATFAANEQPLPDNLCDLIPATAITTVTTLAGALADEVHRLSRLAEPKTGLAMTLSTGGIGMAADAADGLKATGFLAATVTGDDLDLYVRADLLLAALKSFGRDNTVTIALPSATRPMRLTSPGVRDFEIILNPMKPPEPKRAPVASGGSAEPGPVTP